jgi:hypothetical protein
MKLKKLFNEKEMYTDDGHSVDDEFGNLIKDFIQKKADEGYSLRELRYIMNDVIGNEVCYQILKRDMKGK